MELDGVDDPGGRHALDAGPGELPLLEELEEEDEGGNRHGAACWDYSYELVRWERNKYKYHRNKNTKKKKAQEIKCTRKKYRTCKHSELRLIKETNAVQKKQTGNFCEQVS